MSAPVQIPAPAQSRDWPYLVGVGGYAILDTVLQTWLIFLFTAQTAPGGPLVAPAVFGLALLAARVCEAAANPLAGFGADRSGRPWLFLLAGTLVFGAAGLALFWAPGPGLGPLNAALLFALLPLALVAQSSYIVPYLGLLPQLARDDERRVRVSNGQALVLLAGVFVGQVLSGPALKWLDNRLALMATLFIALAMALMLVPLLSVRSLQMERSRLVLAQMGQVLVRNPGFRILVVAQALFWLGFNTVRLAAVFFVTVLLGQEAARLSLFLGAIFLVTVPSLLALRFVVPRLGKRRSMILATGSFAVLLPLLATVGRSVGPLSAEQWALALFASLGFPLAILSVVQNPMVAEQVEQDARSSGQAKGALFFGLQGLAIKLSYGLAAALLGVLQSQFGYSPSQPLGIQLVGPIAGVLALGAAIAYGFYPRDLEQPATQPAETRK
ncbi:MFS transporter [Gloeobacter morelensis]|uniref:MFS transporter n=1 Tax=Gloeobacter morelensis MG652769 TaxID=2781736 RepID=A0ABY3PP48_9CYAN|nr:MFS transporter [Gloeobacter morelensis]UFP95400.1 MFS transporter [Gloeobacter morelensis MG652769]